MTQHVLMSAGDGGDQERKRRVRRMALLLALLALTFYLGFIALGVLNA
ncbi:MAG TPA: hypothetical protein VLT59_11660 [Steroidobacteraceae bacterium]|nr:hypothetical protein [Steroidobacteraceae bacterium]